MAAAAVAVMAKVPGAAPVKSRLHAMLTEARATELYRCFLLDRLDALVVVPGIAPVVAFRPDAARVLTAGEADVVVGPSDDGGSYLIGLRVYRPELFARIPWSTADVLAVTLARAKDLGLGVRLLPSWFDVDTEADLRRLRRELATTSGGPTRTAAFVRELVS